MTDPSDAEKTLAQANVSLLSLPETILFQIASELNEPSETVSRLSQDVTFKLASCDVVALSSVSQRARAALAPLAFRCIALGEQGIPSSEYSKKLKDLQKMRELLLCVRHVEIRNVIKSGLKRLGSCVEAMLNLRHLTHAASIPLAEPIIQSICTSHNLFGGLTLKRFAADTLLAFSGRLPHNQLRCLSVSTASSSPLYVSSLAPIRVAPKRRLGLCGTAIKEATHDEHTNALVQGLSGVLLSSRESLQGFTLQRDGTFGTDENIFQLVWDVARVDGEYPTFPALQSLALHNVICDSPAFQHVLKTSPELKLLSVVERRAQALNGQGVVLKQLESFLYRCVMDLSIAKSVHDLTRHATHLREFELQGFHSKETIVIFTLAHKSHPLFASLRILNLAAAGGALSQRHVQAVVEACPSVENLTLTALTWSATWSDLRNTLLHLTELTHLEHDHPMAHYRVGPHPVPSEGMIRSDAAGHFSTVVAAADQTIAEFILESIKSDIDAWRPLYSRKFLRLAKACPKLRGIIWHPTSETVWRWCVSRRDGILKTEDEATVSFQPAPWQTKRTKSRGLFERCF